MIAKQTHSVSAVNLSLSQRSLVVAASVTALLFFPSVIAQTLQANLVTHMLVQLPLLVLLGWYWADALPANVCAHFNRFNRMGLSGVVLMSLVALFWMLPRTLDASLESAGFAVAKAVMLVFLFGATLRLSNRIMHPIVRGVWLLEGWAMLMRLGWVYQVSPERLCSNYLLGEQQLLGAILIAGGAVWAVLWITKILFGLHPGHLSTLFLKLAK